MTLADIRKKIDNGSQMWAGVDSTCPDGTFIVVCKYFDVVRTYLLAGTPDQDDAPILGRIDAGQRTFSVGNRMLGGTIGFVYPTDTTEDVFARIVEKAKTTAS